MLSEIFSPNRIILDLESATKTDVFGELIEKLDLSVSEYDRQKLLDAVFIRENKMSTNIQPGLAVPHGYCSNVQGVVGAIGFHRTGIEYDYTMLENQSDVPDAAASEPDKDQSKNPVHMFFMLLMDESSREQHLQVFGRLLDLFKSPLFSEIQKAKTPQEAYDLLCCF